MSDSGAQLHIGANLNRSQTSTLVRRSPVKGRTQIRIRRQTAPERKDDSSSSSDSLSQSVSSDSSPATSRKSSPPSFLNLPNVPLSTGKANCVSPSQKWEDHYKQIIDGTKFLNIVGAENVTDERVLEDQDTSLLDRLRSLSDSGSCVDEELSNQKQLLDLKSSSDGGSMWRLGDDSNNSRQHGNRAAEDKTEAGTSSIRSHAEKPSNCKRQERPVSSFYESTPDEEDVYDNAPWNDDTLNEMLRSDRLSWISFDLESSKNCTPSKHKPLSNTSSFLSNTDSGLGWERSDSLTETDNELEKKESLSTFILTDLSESTLDKASRKIDSSSTSISSAVNVDRLKRNRMIRTKKCRGLAISALKEMETKNVNPKTRYICGDMIGQGAFGTVYIARDNDTNEVVAVKKVSLQQGQKQLALIVKELEALTTLQHGNIVNYRGSYQVDNILWIVMDYLEGGSLTDVIETMELDDKYIATITAECLKALSYLHSKRIIHRDIKSDNILMGINGEVKLTDFGCCAQLHTKDARRQTAIGTPYWMSPEAIKGKQYNEKADIWSLGVLVVEMIDGTPPYIQLSPNEACKKILKKKGMPTIQNKISPSLETFVKKCFHRSVDKRLSANDLLLQPFIISNAADPSILKPLIEAVHEELYLEDHST